MQFACAPMMKQPMQTSDARLGANSSVYDDMLKLPEPNEPVVVAVYKFRDQTGQYKPSDIGANWSTAVTQGATSILINSLEESGWFVPIEREGLANLLNDNVLRLPACIGNCASRLFQRQKECVIEERVLSLAI